ncbi:hypothetical protein ACFQX7_00280 [Luedemannella flava]
MNARYGWTVAGVVAVLIAAVALAVSAVRDGGHVIPTGAPTLAAPSTAAPTTLPAPSDRASDGGGLRIVEHGFTQLSITATLTLTPGYGPGRPEPYTPVHSAFIVENTSRDQVALSPTIVVRYLDRAGKAIVEYAAETADKRLTAEVLRPGQRVGIVDYFNISGRKVARVEVRAVGAVWLDPADPRASGSTITADGVSLIRTGVPEASIVAFTAHSAYPATVSAVANAVYRDRAGKILGAATTATSTASTSRRATRAVRSP